MEYLQRPESGRPGRAARPAAARPGHLPAPPGLRGAGRGPRRRPGPPRPEAGQHLRRPRRRPARRRQAARLRPRQPHADPAADAHPSATLPAPRIHVAEQAPLRPPARPGPTSTPWAPCLFPPDRPAPFLGKAAFGRDDRPRLEPVESPSRIRPELPARPRRVVLRCLAKEPEDRFPERQQLE